MINQQNDTSAPKARSTRRLLALSILMLICAVVSTIYWYQQPQSSPAPTAEVINPVDKPQDPPVATNGAETVDEAVEEIVDEAVEEVKEDSALEFSDDSSTIPQLPSSDPSEPVTLQPTVPITPIVKPDIKPEPPKVDQKLQQDPQPVPEQPPTTIQPFGGLTWDDDLLTAIQKVQACTDPKLTIIKGGPYNTIRLKGPVDQASLHKLRWRPGKVYAIADKVIVRPIQITGHPLVLEKGIFSITVEFASHPGMVISKDNEEKCRRQARQVLGPEANCLFPLRMYSVSLSLHGCTDATELSRTKRQEIVSGLLKILKRKYRVKRYFTHNESRTSIIWQDKNEQILQLSAHLDKNVLLLYQKKLADFATPLKSLQDKTRTAAHIAKTKDFPDRSDGL